MRKKERAQQDAAASEARESEVATTSSRGSGPRRLTPVDVQQKVFRLSVRGYNEREVDQFLDEVTEEIARLHAENKRFREDLETRGTARLSTDAAIEGDAVMRRARAEADRIIAEAESRARSVSADPDWKAGLGRFLSREKEFLQSLASLIQLHAEGVKDDAQRARDEQAARPPLASSAAEPMIDLTRREQQPEATSLPVEPAGEQSHSSGSSLSSIEAGSGNGPSDRDDVPWGPPDPSRAIDSPRPGASRRLEAVEVEGGQEERSIRELFWGED
jgi:DivIVA domain-containing protein